MPSLPGNSSNSKSDGGHAAHMPSSPTLLRFRQRIPYAELHVHSAYSFLDGASLPEELVSRACELELDALALTDHAGFPGIMQLAAPARSAGMPIVVGTELTLGAGECREPAHDAEYADNKLGLGPKRGKEIRKAPSLKRESDAHKGRNAKGEPKRKKGLSTKNPEAAEEHILLLARDATGYQKLSHTVGAAMLASGAKGEAHYTLEGLAEASAGNWVVLTGCRKGGVRRALEKTPGVWAPQAARRELERLIGLFGRDNVAVELTATGSPLDRERCDLLADLACNTGVRAVATGNVHYARLQDRPVADVLAATGARMTLEEIDPYLPASGSYLRSGAQMLAWHKDRPAVVSAAAQLGQECAFDLALVTPNLPRFPVPEGHDEQSWLRALTDAGGRRRYGTRSVNPTAWAQIDHEIDVINQLGFPGYFLIIEEIVSFCRQQGIWCQGRGSAANSAVCFALGITAVDAVRHKMLFERFLSPGRSGPPDIDLDIESGRREEVIQHVYERYGRDKAAQVANTITYRPRLAIRDAARALGYDPGQAEYWTKSVEHRVPQGRGRTSDPTKERAAADMAVFLRERGREALFTHRWQTDGVPPEIAALAARMQNLPRHLGIHSGGMVLCDRPVIDVCPVSWASMPGRTVLQWDKDDCAEAGLVKFDLLGLGMLTALRIAFTALQQRGISGEDGQELGLHNLAQEDPRVYRLLQAADTVGVFQVESRAQMSTLPRLRPECFYDIVIEVALIRPGPIQGHSVNPYLRRRRGQEPVTYAHPLLQSALEKTLGIPLFQEQLMQIAVDAAGFSPAQADKLRKAMGAKRSVEQMERLRGELLAGMQDRGIDRKTGEEIYAKLQAFAEFGFPESHAFSFAYLVYASAWLKVHHPEEFYAGMLAAQPLGFYSPQTLVADARRHGVLVLPPDVVASQQAACVEECAAREMAAHELVDASPNLAVRLGLESVRGLGAAATRILQARADAPFSSVADMASRARLNERELEALAAADALRSLGTNRRQGIWLAHALAEHGMRRGIYYQPTIPGTEAAGTVPPLPEITKAEAADADIAATGVSTASYPIEFLRPHLDEQGIRRITDLSHVPEDVRIRVAGIVTHRQRPYTASGTTFLSLEDETGLLNVVVSHGLWQRYRMVALYSQGLIVRGMVERGDGAMNFVADALEELPLSVQLKSRDFR